ncbi:MFS transporter [Frigoribacterium salinisoli]
MSNSLLTRAHRQVKAIRDQGGPFRWLLAAEFITAAGTELSLVAISLAVITSGGSALDIGLVLMARSLPPLLVLFFGGVVVDRLPRGRIIVVASSLAFLVQLLLSVEFTSGTPSLAVLLSLQAALGAITAALRPAIVGILPQIVVQERLQSANGLLAIAGNTASILGPVAAGVLLAAMTPATLILLDSFTFAAAALVMLRAWKIRAPKRSTPSPYWAEVREGWHHVWTTRWLLVTVLQALVFQATFAVFFVLGPVLASRAEGGGSWWAALAASYGVGAIAGSFVALRYRPRIPLIAMQVTLMFAVPLLLLAATPIPLIVLVPITVMAGVAASLGDTLWETYFQTVTPNYMLGRVSAIANLGAASLRPLGYLVAGQAAVTVGMSATFGISGLALVLSILATLLVLVPIRNTLRTSQDMDVVA